MNKNNTPYIEELKLILDENIGLFEGDKTLIQIKEAEIINWLTKTIESERERVIGKQADDMRKGQTVFNFLVWLKEEKGVDGKNKMADPFYITDDNWDKLFKEYTKTINKLKK